MYFLFKRALSSRPSFQNRLLSLPLPLPFLALIPDKFRREVVRGTQERKEKKKERKEEERKRGNVKHRTALTGRSYP